MIEVFLVQQFSPERWRWEDNSAHLSLEEAKLWLFLKKCGGFGLRKWRIVRKTEEVVHEEGGVSRLDEIKARWEAAETLLDEKTADLWVGHGKVTINGYEVGEGDLTLLPWYVPKMRDMIADQRTLLARLERAEAVARAAEAYRAAEERAEEGRKGPNSLVDRLVRGDARKILDDKLAAWKEGVDE